MIVDPALRARAGEERVAVKTVGCASGPWRGRARALTIAGTAFADPNHTREQALEAFHHEITAMWSLSFHPNVVKLIAFDDATSSMIQPLYDVSASCARGARGA